MLGIAETAGVAAAAVVATSVLHALFIAVAGGVLRGVEPGRGVATRMLRDPLFLVALSLWLMLAHGISIYGWGATLAALGAVTDLSEGVFKAALAYTTLGLGEAELPVRWRLLSGVAAANGLFLFGLSASFMFTVFAKLRIGGRA